MVSGVSADVSSDTPAAPTDPTEAAAISTMAVECLVVLCNPQQMLDPTISQELAAMEDVLSIPQATIVASTLLEILSSMGANIPLAERILRLMAGTPPGRIALRRAAAALHATATKEPISDDPTMAQIVSAAQWVATRYWGLSQQAQHGSGPGVEAYADVADIMKEIVQSLQTDGADLPPPRPPASERFGAAAKAATTAAVAAGQDLSASESRWDRGVLVPPILDAAGTAVSNWDPTFGVFDAATSMFWKNFRARAVQQTPAATALVLRKYTRRTCLPDEHLTVADTLKLPLTRPLRPLTEEMGVSGAEQGTEDGLLTGGEGTGVIQEGVGSGILSPQIQSQDLLQQQLKVQPPVLSPGFGTTQHAAPAMPISIPVANIPPISSAPVISSAAPPADFDLYADLGPDFGLAPAPASVPQHAQQAIHVAPPSGVVQKNDNVKELSAGLEEEITTQKEQADIEMAEAPNLDPLERPPIESAVPEEAPGAAISHLAAEHSPEPGASAAPVPAVIAPQKAPSAPVLATREVSLDDPAALLKDPGAIAALLKDPAKMQELLLRNPALLAVLKTKLGSGSAK